MSFREEQCNKVCRILDDVLANRPTERDSLITAVRIAFSALNCSEIPNSSDSSIRQDVIDALQKEINKGIPPFDDVMGSIRCGVRLARNIIEDLPSAQPERTCVNCGRTVNNGGWYADGGTRCPIEEHYALPKDGYCHLWEKRNVTDDDYPERQ